MGISIEPHFYDELELIAALKRDGADDEGKLRAILDKFGLFIGGKYFLMNNERTEDGNPYYALAAVLGAAFTYKGAEDDFFDTYLHAPSSRGPMYVDAREAAEELGIELPDDKYFGLYLDGAWDELWHVAEEIQDGGANHTIAFKAETAEEAARIMAERLTPHIAKRMYESDKDGRSIER
jgi:hypothetical protein